MPTRTSPELTTIIETALRRAIDENKPPIEEAREAARAAGYRVSADAILQIAKAAGLDMPPQTLDNQT